MLKIYCLEKKGKSTKRNNKPNILNIILTFSSHFKNSTKDSEQKKKILDTQHRLMSGDSNSLKPLKMQNSACYVYDLEDIHLIHTFGCILNDECSCSF